MIKSILDQDLYTFTVAQAILEQYPDAEAEYEFINRDGTPLTDENFVGMLKHEIQRMAALKLETDEGDYLTSEYDFFKPQYLAYLKNYRFNPAQVQVETTSNLSIKIAGPWHETIYWEVPLLAMVSESYYRTIDKDWFHVNGKIWDQYLADTVEEKARKLAIYDCRFADFGTRRRRAYSVHDEVCKILSKRWNVVGTSNVFLAKKHKMRAIGTMSHQWIMGVSGLESLRHANRYALHGWNKTYHGNLGIALSDTFGTAAFFDDFDYELARLFDGTRHDSGCPFKYAENMVALYNKRHIDPGTKTIVFSDGLNVQKVIEIRDFCKKLGILPAFGIGTKLTNDFPTKALNIVIKLRRIRPSKHFPWIEVVKLSDVPTKAIGDPNALACARYIFHNIPVTTAV